MTKPTCKYTPDCTYSGNCPLTITVTNGSGNPSMTKTGSDSGTNYLVVNASGVNSASTVNVTKTISVSITGNSKTAARTHSVPISVLPCLVTTQSIANRTTFVGQSSSWNFSAYGINTQSGHCNTSYCGSPVYSLVGSHNYLSFNTSTRTLTLNTNSHSNVRSNTAHVIRAWPSSFSNNYTDKTFYVTIN